MELSNIRSGGGASVDRYNAYIRWANEAVRRLRHMVQAVDLERLILTRRYWLLQSMPMNAGITPVADLLNSEIDERARAFDDAVEALNRRIERWSRPGVFALPDTSMFINCPEKLEDWDLAPLLSIREDPIHVLVPIIVVDELDRLKESNNNRTRWRAGYSLAVLDRLVGDAMGSGQLKAADFSALSVGGIPRGEVTIEIVLDPPGHARLPLEDDEIVDRALSAQGLADRPVTLITYDTGQSMRARAAGLRAVKLSTPTSTDGQDA